MTHSSLSPLLLQAQTAATQADWSTVVTLLPQLVLPAPPSPDPDFAAEVLGLAIQVLREGDFQDQWDAAKVFPPLGAIAIAPLIDLLDDDTAELEARWFAARILGQLDDPVAIRALVNQLQTTDDDDLSQVIAEALSNLGQPAITALTDLVLAADTRLFAVQALAQIRQTDTIAPLLTVVHDADATIRTIALEALSSFHDDRILPVLVAALTDPGVTVRKAAIAGLRVRVDQVEAWNLVERLAALLWDLNLGVCQQAALALGKLGQDAAIPLLERAFSAAQTPLPLQLDILRALGWIGSPAAIACLQTILTPHPGSLDVAIYEEGARILGQWEAAELKPTSLQILITLLTLPPVQQTPSLRRLIAIAIGELKLPQALQPLANLLDDADTSVQLHALSALKRLTSHAPGLSLTQLQSLPDLSEAQRVRIQSALNASQGVSSIN